MKLAENPFAGVLARAKKLVSEMTLEEKASLCSGKDFWTTKAVERLGVKSYMVTDGPHGLRKQAGASDHLGLNASVPATCFPAASATSCCFDRELLEEMGSAIGRECRQEEVAIILGPAANIKRNPLCGRNFEYFSEDPLVSGESAAALISGIQSENVGTCLKHYLANNQEKARLVSNSVIDERALREIYLAGFETAVKKAQPWSMMCSYNQINGTYASDNKRLMTDVPRDEWGFGGAIMTDWGAMNDRVEAVKAGLDLEMPGGSDYNDKKIIEAVKNGELEEADVDKCAVRMTAIALLAEENDKTTYNAEEHNLLAAKVARESAVLLKRGRALPVKRGDTIAVIGEFAEKPRYQGAGSSKINPTKITSLLDALAEKDIPFMYAPGYRSEEEKPDEELIADAVRIASKADVVIACVGLPDSFESEGFDRTHLNMPENQNALMKALCQCDTPVAALVSAGAPIDMPWRGDVDSILLMYLAGQNIGSAQRDLVFGKAVPCGKLSETWPLALEDTPSIANFGCGGNVEYRESIYVGYRYYDKAEKQVAYPFGFGLSYTDFKYESLVLDKKEIGAKEKLNVAVTLTNTGNFDAKEVVEVYVSAPASAVFKPVRELRAFEKVFLKAGETKTVNLTLDGRAFSFYNVNINDWYAESGEYIVTAGASSRDMLLAERVTLRNTEKSEVPDYRNTAPSYYAPSGDGFNPPKEEFETVLGREAEPWHPVRPFTMNSTLSEICDCPEGRELYAQISEGMKAAMGGSSDDIAAMIEAMLDDMPFRQFAMIGGENFSPDKLTGILVMLNNTKADR